MRPRLLVAVAPVLLAVFLLASRGICAPSSVSEDSAASQPPRGSPVVFAGDTLWRVVGRLGPFGPAERAAAISQRLERISHDPLHANDTVTFVHGDLFSDLVAGDVQLASVTDADTLGTGLSRTALAETVAARVQHALAQRAHDTSLRSVLFGALFALVATAVFVGLLWFLGRFFRRGYAAVNSRRGTTLRGLRIRNYEVLSADRIADLLIGFAKLLRIAFTLILAYTYLSVALGFFPWTRGFAGTLLAYVLSPLKTVLRGVLAYLPKGFFVVVIVLVTRYVLKFVRRIFLEIGRGTITFPGFYVEWAEPTYKIVRFLILGFVVVVIFPYLPGSDSPAFKGVSIFLGVLFSLGSTSAIANMVAGMLLTYMRPFKVGDRVQIADTVGDVMEKTLLVTRVRTIKNVLITVPNAMVMSSHIINYSSSADQDGLILHTSVTIGYDAPWKQVHELLIAAARATPGILEKPAPFVLQTSLDDFYVSYEINAYTDDPNRMAAIYSELHQNIQDKFNDAGVEIMSPHYSALRDGNEMAVPRENLPKDYQSPGFRIFPWEHRNP
jgi:small-conductance mechanosensitive channel